jgi:hypothetical protein
MRESFRDPSGHGVRLQSFLDLARFRIQNILLVFSHDSFILAEDGQLSDLVLTESLDLALRRPPTLTRVSTGGRRCRWRCRSAALIS